MKTESIENLKIAIIYGKNKVDGVEREGQIEEILKEEPDTAHVFYLKDFLKTHFLDEEVLQESAKTNNVNTMLFELQRLGHIIFTESTSKKSAVKEGTLFVPEARSERQNRAFESFRQQLEKEDYHLFVLSDLKRDEDGTIVGRQKICTAKEIRTLTESEPER